MFKMLNLILMRSMEKQSKCSFLTFLVQPAGESLDSFLRLSPEDARQLFGKFSIFEQHFPF